MTLPRLFTILLVASISLPMVTAVAEPPALTGSLRPGHPRLLWTADQTDAVRERLENDPLSVALFQQIRKRADAMLDEPPIERVLKGRRLLGKSRTALDRILTLSTLWRITGDRRYLKRAKEEMLAVAAFDDWNPSHFLDTAEMTAALGIGYDWLHEELSEETREQIRTAIVEKGIKPSLKKEKLFIKGTNNWNQVCNGGITMGALAIAEHEPELAEQIVRRAVNGVPKAMNQYEPDGNYPEGPGYWSYGTTYNVLLIAALESALGSDLNLGKSKGFRRSPAFMRHAMGPTGSVYNYSDGSSSLAIQPAYYWFAGYLDDPTLATAEDRRLREALEPDGKPISGRFDPLILVWRDPEHAQSKNAPDPPLSWVGQGPNPVALLRSGWDSDALFVGIKGGTPNESHGHMDNGSFILERDGVRWVIDLKVRGYHSMESAGVQFWNRSQNSERWKVLETTPFAHSTLTLNDSLHRADQFAGLKRLPEKPDEVSVMVDLTATLGPDAGEAHRTFSMLPNRRLVIRDELRGLAAGTRVRWAIPTPAKVALQGNHATLSLNDRELTVSLTSPDSTEFRVEELSRDDPPWSVPIPGVRMLVADCTAPENGTLVIEVQFGGK